MTDMKKRIDVATGRRKADLVLKSGNIINVFTREIFEGDVAVADGIIAGIGTYDGIEEVDCRGKYICPGFIDAHLHIESSMVLPHQLARAVIRSGTTTMIADPHEIVNVAGSAAMSFLLDATENLPVTTYLMLPSSVPATAFETAGAPFTASDMAPFIHHPRVLGLGEVMCYPDVLAADPTILEKLYLLRDKIADGHAPGLTGKELQAYGAAGVATEHECTTFEEAAKKVRAGLSVLIREGSAAKNLGAILRDWVDSGLPYDRLLFCTDDKHIEDTRRDGHIRWNVRQAIHLGVPPVIAICMATIHAATAYGLSHVGAVAAGYDADLVILDDLKKVTVSNVYKKGIPWETLIDTTLPPPVPEEMYATMKFRDITPDQLKLAVGESSHVIEMEPYQITTLHKVEPVPSANGLFTPNETYSKLCVVERHGHNGNIAVAPLKGYGIRQGAIATSVAHDSHNIIAAGDNDEDLALAINHLRKIGGGYAIVSGGKVVGDLPLPVAGLMSDLPFEQVQENTNALLSIAKSLGIPSHLDPFISLSFMALPVIPEIRLTDMGLFDVERFSLL